MISKNLYLNIMFRIILIILLSILLGYLITESQSFRFILICILTIVFITISLVSYLNTTNRNISFFFDSIRNDDSSLSFPTDMQNKTFDELHRSMNRVNQQIKNLKIENRSQEQYFAILLEHIATGVITYDNRGFIRHANSAAKRLLSMDILTHLQQLEHLDPKLAMAIKVIKPAERRLITISTLEGEIQVALKAASFRTNEAELMILSIEDIKNELDEKELESWMKLIRVLTHEIMNSITPITSLSESLSGIYYKDGRPIMPEEITERTISTTLQGLNVIKEQGKGLRSFVESYRKLIRIPEPEKKIFIMDELMERLQVLFNSMQKSDNISLSVIIRNPGLKLFADQNLISQVLVNLVKNAIEANEDNPNAVIRIIVSLDINNHPEICIIDNGPGIASSHLDEIFVPFFTTRQNGSGIGLSISRQIMKMHGGNLKVRSVPDKETVFCMSF